jgi:hypothetical protein
VASGTRAAISSATFCAGSISSSISHGGKSARYGVARGPPAHELPHSPPCRTRRKLDRGDRSRGVEIDDDLLPGLGPADPRPPIVLSEVVSVLRCSTMATVSEVTPGFTADTEKYQNPLPARGSTCPWPVSSSHAPLAMAGTCSRRGVPVRSTCWPVGVMVNRHWSDVGLFACTHQV